MSTCKQGFAAAKKHSRTTHNCHSKAQKAGGIKHTARTTRDQEFMAESSNAGCTSGDEPGRNRAFAETSGYPHKLSMCSTNASLSLSVHTGPCMGPPCHDYVVQACLQATPREDSVSCWCSICADLLVVDLLAHMSRECCNRSRRACTVLQSERCALLNPLSTLCRNSLGIDLDQFEDGARQSV